MPHKTAQHVRSASVIVCEGDEEAEQEEPATATTTTSSKDSPRPAQAQSDDKRSSVVFVTGAEAAGVSAKGDSTNISVNPRLSCSASPPLTPPSPGTAAEQPPASGNDDLIFQSSAAKVITADRWVITLDSRNGLLLII